MASNNPPYVTVELTKEQYDFLILNCDTNLRMTLTYLQGVKERDMGEKIVSLIESFKSIKTTLEKAPK